MKDHAPALLQTVLLCIATAGLVRAQDSDAHKPPRLRYVDHTRTEREARLSALSTARLSGTVGYRLQFTGDKNSECRVDVEFQVAEPGDLLLVMPAWRPGSYLLENYGKRVEGFFASGADGAKLEVDRPVADNPNLWRAKNTQTGKLTVSYRIPSRLFRASRRGKPCFQVNGPAMWLHEIRHKQLACKVEIGLPPEWIVSTGLRAAKGTTGGRDSNGTWRFTAHDYDVLVDCPLRMGFFETYSFRIGKVPFEISLVGADHDRTDRQEFAMRVKKISKHFIDMFGGAPMDRYVFLFRMPGGGGLEHKNSTTIGLMSLTGSVPGKPSMWDFVIAHEFFHLWNVKRLRPEALGPFDYTGPNRTTALWFCEGVTSYYGALCLPRVGLTSANDYWRRMGRNYTRLRRNPVRKQISVADSSWKVWDGSYMFNRKRIDYYLKGECLGLLLDVLIRDGSDNEKSLDDVMRTLYAQCIKTGKGFVEDDIRDTCIDLAGLDLGDFFDDYVYGTQDLPVETVLAKAGVEVDVTGEGRRQRIQLHADPKASGLPLRIRKSLTDVWK